jgi:O-antigen/teichoic acid export membrane protein
MLHKLKTGPGRLVFNAGGSIGLRAGSVVLSFVQTRQLITGMRSTEAGLWFTMLSSLTWIGFFELGIGSGLKNQLSFSLANREIDQAKALICSAYGGLLMVLFPVVVVACIAIWNLPTNIFLNSPQVSRNDLNFALILSLIGVFFNLYLGLGSQIAAVLGWPILQPLTGLVSQAVFVGSVAVIIKWTGSLTLRHVALAYCAAQVLVQCGATYFIFKRAPHLIPSRRPEMHAFRKVIRLAYKFAIIQLAVFLTFNTANIIITKQISPAQVRIYASVTQYFTLTAIAFGAISNVLWPALAGAVGRADLAWIRMAVRRTLLLYIGLAGIIVIQLLIARPVFNFWLKGKIVPGSALLIGSAMSAGICLWSQFNSLVLNASSELRGQLVTAILGMLITGPLMILLIKNGVGLTSAPIAVIVGVMPFSVYGFLKVRKMGYL